MKNLLLIIDGNRRWAKDNGVPQKDQYMKTLTNDIFNYANVLSEWNEVKKDDEEFSPIETMTIWLSSPRNMQRSYSDVKAFVDALDVMATRIQSNSEYTFFPVGRDSHQTSKIWPKLFKRNIDSELTVQLLLNSFGNDCFLPPIDAIIRTGGRKRLSNLSVPNILNAELYFTDTLIPDLTVEMFDGIVHELLHRTITNGL